MEYHLIPAPALSCGIIEKIKSNSSSKDKLIKCLNDLEQYTLEDYINLALGYYVSIIPKTLVFDTTTLSTDLMLVEAGIEQYAGDIEYASNVMHDWGFRRATEEEYITEEIDPEVKNAYISESIVTPKYVLPHPYIFVELANNPEVYASIWLVRYTEQNMMCYINIHDIKSGDYDYIQALFGIKEENNETLVSYRASVNLSKHNGDEDVKHHNKRRSMFINSIIETLFNRINDVDTKRYNIYSEDTNERPRYISKGGTTLKAMNRPTYIVLDKEIKETEVRKYARKSDSKIEYSFSWIVRGHYRRLHNPESFGKDMLDRPVRGKTWVESYTKGDRNLPLKNTQYKVVEQERVYANG
jgi:hypothetical protein